MKNVFLKKPIRTLVAIGSALIMFVFLYNAGCSGSGSGWSLCNVPQEASLSSATRIGGATTSVGLFSSDDAEWSLFNIANELRATKVGTTKDIEYAITVPGLIRDIEIVTHDDKRLALLAMGDEGIAAVDITDPSAMSVITMVKVNYYQDGISWTEGGGDVVIDNIIQSTRGPISSLAVFDDGNPDTPLQLLIADEGYGLHKTALDNLLDETTGREPDGTLLVEQEVYTLQYAGEQSWGGPKGLTLYNGKLFVAQGYLGMGIFDPISLEQVGRYNLYTDTTEANNGEDWFIDMDPVAAVQTGNIDACTGMPDFNQASFEIQQVWHGDVVAPTPWADFERYGKHYYDARKIEVATFTGAGPDKTIAYIAYGLGGLVAVDVTGYDTAISRDPVTCNPVAPTAEQTPFLEASYLGYVPALPAHGPDKQTGEQSQSLFPYFGVGMLKEAGVVDVEVNLADNQVYFTDHFAGMMVIGNADTPEVNWHGSAGEDSYDNNTIGDLGDHWPDYEFVTSYDMTPVPFGEETAPAYIFESPILLATGEVSGHGNVLSLTGSFDVANSGSVDVVAASGGGGLSFIDVALGNTPAFEVPVHFATTNEIGAAADGSANQEINIGHTEGLTAYGSNLYLADGPHGMSIWKIADQNCVATDDVHLIANTLQSEYPVKIDDTLTINPTPHAHDVVLDAVSGSALVMSQSRGLRRVNISELGTVGTPTLLYPNSTDIFEHNIDSGNVVDFLKMQDHVYDVALKGSLAFTADGSNGLTVYDLSKDPSDATSGYIVSNLGGDVDSQPNLGHATGVALWKNTATSKEYAFVAAGQAGIGVVDVTDPINMILIKVFEPIKMEDDHVGKADGKSVAVKVVGNHVYFTYDSFGVVVYRTADLIAPLIEGTDPNQIWTLGGSGDDQRPNAVARFKLQDPTLFGLVDLVGWAGGAAGMDVVQVNGRNLFYIAYGDAGVIKVDWSNPAAPVLLQHTNTVGFAYDIDVVNGRAYVADGGGGLLLLK